MKNLSRFSVVAVALSLSLASVPLPAFSAAVVATQAVATAVPGGVAGLPVVNAAANLGGAPFLAPASRITASGSLVLPKSPVVEVAAAAAALERAVSFSAPEAPLAAAKAFVPAAAPAAASGRITASGAQASKSEAELVDSQRAAVVPSKGKGLLRRLAAVRLGAEDDLRCFFENSKASPEQVQPVPAGTESGGPASLQDLLVELKLLERELSGEIVKREHSFLIELMQQNAPKAAVDAPKGLPGVLARLRRVHWDHLAVAPFIYACFFPAVLLDAVVSVYQAVCFPVYGIPQVRREDYIAFDRGFLAYLRLFERFNCMYCSYFNGLMAYASEIAGRTEQFWCPIKHARKLAAVHSRYAHFFEYGDAEGYRQGLANLRKAYEDVRRGPQGN
ncbi:MAG: hypothetical protein WC969_01890 [Elusimicrobiota bacterium]|jgi:hypothetical protein